MKLLIVAPYFFERHRWMISAYKTALALSQHIDVVVLTTGQPATETINPRLRIYRLRDWFLPDPINYSIVPGLWGGLRRILRSERPDVILVNKHMFFTSLAVPLLRLMGRKSILATDTFPGMNWFPRHPLVRFVMRIYAYVVGWPILKLAHRVVLFHEGLIPDAQRLGLRYEVIHNGVDIAALDAASPAQDIPHRAEEVNICYIGRLETIKGYDDILAVAQRILANHAQAHFYFIGSYHGKEEMVRNLQSDRLHFLGHRNDVFGLLKRMDIFVLASYSEGLPNAVMEAMAAGVACVCSDVGGVRTLITHRQEGLLFPAGDREAMYQALVDLLVSPQPRQTMAQAGRQKIRSQYDWEQIAQQYLHLFHRLQTTP